MLYLTGYTQAEAEHWESVFLALAREQLGTQAEEWGKVQLSDGTWAVMLDEQRQALASIPEELLARLHERISEGRLKSREALITNGLWPEPQESNMP